MGLWALKGSPEKVPLYGVIGFLQGSKAGSTCWGLANLW